MTNDEREVCIYPSILPMVFAWLTVLCDPTGQASDLPLNHHQALHQQAFPRQVPNHQALLLLLLHHVIHHKALYHQVLHQVLHQALNNYALYLHN